jgi:UDP-N-acetylglucosamine 4,6-dehydratase
LMTLDDAVDLVLYAFKNSNQGDLFIQKAPACTIDTLADAMMEYIGKTAEKRIIGTRHGEKLFETLVTKEEMARSMDLGGYYRVMADNRDLNYESFFSKGDKQIEKAEEYTSHNTRRLDKDGVIEMLKKIGSLREQA